MKPFSIACTTCQARLRVRDDSVIGQILTCPKCGSMVLVEPVAATVDASQNVEPSKPHDSAPQDLAAARKTVPPKSDSAIHSDFEDAANFFDEPSEPPAPTSPDLTDTVEDLAVQAESRRAALDDNVGLDIARGWKSEPVATDAPDDAAESELPPPPLPVSDEVLLPNADWTSATTVQWRNRVLTGMAAVAGVVLALMLLIVFSGGSESSTSASAPSSTGEDVPGQLESLEHEGQSEDVIANTAPPPSKEDPADDASAGELPREGASDDSKPPIESPAETPAADDANPDPAPNGVEPVPNDPPPDEPPGLTPKEANNDPGAADSTPSPLAETMREFTELLDKTEEPARPIAEVEASPAGVAEADEKEGGPVVRRTGPRVIEIADRLKDPVKQIDFQAVPLGNFLRFISDYSTIPITLDADILRWSRISPLTAVTVQAADTTVAQSLQQALAPLGLEYQVEADQLFITRRPKNENGMREVSFKVEDLVGDDTEQLEQLGDHIMDFVAPDSWSSRGGIGTMTYRGSELVIEQYESVQFEILEFCEKLRVARGSKPRGPYDESMFRLETRGERAREKLAKSITLTYIQAAPLQRIVDRIAAASKLHILIDWRALAEAEWSPDAEVGFAVADEPIAKALSTLLEPMDLAYRVVDESTLQITTPEVLDSRLEIEFYHLPKIADDGAQLVQAVRDALGPANFRDAGGNGQLAFDMPSKCLLVCLSQSRQIELKAWLDAQ